VNLIIDKEKHLIFLNGNEYDIPLKEFDVLNLLANTPGKFYTRKEIFEKIWGANSSSDEKTVDVHISFIRKKLGNHIIRTKRRIGYCIRVNDIKIISGSKK